MSALGKLQREFAPLIAKLILYAYECGYEVTVGHFYRCGDCKIGKERLAKISNIHNFI